MIRIESLNKYYNKGKSNEIHVINDTTITLPDTGLVCILGESGSGKTTLMNTVSGLDTFYNGVIDVDGTQIKKFGSKVQEYVRNEKFGYIFQNYYLLMDRTVEYNIMLALSMYNLSEEEKEERIEYVLKAVNMMRYKKRVVAQLSGGQQQRVAIARALARSPRVIFADEPTGNLDEGNTMNIMGILKKISKSCLVVIVTHEKTIAEFFADKILWITDGRIEREVDRDSKSVYQYADDNNLYLQEFSREELTSGGVSLEIYNGGETKALVLQLVYDNGKLYLGAGDSANVEFLTDNSDKKIIDSKRPMVEEKDVNKIAYDLEPVKASKKPRMGLREIVDIAGKNRKVLGVKQIFLAVTMFIMAVMVVLSIQEVLPVVMFDVSTVVHKDMRYYKLSSPMLKDTNTPHEVYFENFGLMTSALSEAGYEVYAIPKTTLEYQYEGIVQMENESFEIEEYCFMPVDKIGETPLLYGELPKAETEVVLDRLVIERFLNSTEVVSNIITDIKQVIGNKISTTQGIELTITGISDTGNPDIYVQPRLIPGLCRENFSFMTEEEAQKQYADYVRKDLKIREDGKVEVLISRESLKNQYTNYLMTTYGALARKRDEIKNYEKWNLPEEDLESERQKLRELEEYLEMTVEEYEVLRDSETAYEEYSYEDRLTGNIKYIVVGCYDIDVEAEFIVPEEAVEYYDRAVMDSSTACYVYAEGEDVETIKQQILDVIPEDVKELLHISISNEAMQAVNDYEQENNEKLQGRILIVLTIFLIAMVILYFIMKANAIDRMKDLGVYRMLGISKRSIVGMFACENFMITSYTSVPGVFITSFITFFISRVESLQINIVYPWYAMLLTVVFFYIMNIFVGILPVLRLLRLPPAQLAVKYDV